MLRPVQTGCAKLESSAQQNLSINNNSLIA